MILRELEIGNIVFFPGGRITGLPGETYNKNLYNVIPTYKDINLHNTSRQYMVAIKMSSRVTRQTISSLGSILTMQILGKFTKLDY